MKEKEKQHDDADAHEGDAPVGKKKILTWHEKAIASLLFERNINSYEEIEELTKHLPVIEVERCI